MKQRRLRSNDVMIQAGAYRRTWQTTCPSDSFSNVVSVWTGVRSILSRRGLAFKRHKGTSVCDVVNDDSIIRTINR